MTATSAIHRVARRIATRGFRGDHEIRSARRSVKCATVTKQISGCRLVVARYSIVGETRFHPLSRNGANKRYKLVLWT